MIHSLTLAFGSPVSLLKRLATALALVGAVTFAQAQTRPAIVLSQATVLGKVPSGGFNSGYNPTGGSFAVTQQGDIVIGNTYGGSVYLYNGVTGAVSTLATISNPGGVTIDAQNNLYIAHLFSATVLKVPFVNGKYVTVTDTTPAACTGNDTTLCSFANAGAGSKTIGFDKSGNFFSVNTPDEGSATSTGATVLYECNKACQPAGTSTKVYSDTNAIGSIAFDNAGNLFFTDASYTSGSNVGGLQSTNSALKELVFAAGAYAATPITLATYTDATPSGYDDTLGAVAVDSQGTIYYSTQYNNLLALPSMNGVVNTANVYGVYTSGAKGMTLDQKGNLYTVGYNNTLAADAVSRILVNNIALSAVAPGGTATTATATIMVNDGGCSNNPALTFTAVENGAAVTEFTGSAGATCGGQTGGSYFTGTFTFSPTTVGSRTAQITIADTKNGGSSIAVVSGTGQGSLFTIDPGTATAYTTGFTTPLSSTPDGAGNLYIADAGKNSVFRIAAGSTTPTAIGTGFNSPSATAIDAAGNLFVADSGNNQIVEFPNINGTLAGQTTVLANTTAIAGTVLSNPTGLASGPAGTLYIADTGNNRVVTLRNGAAGVIASGLNQPTGLVVDAAANLYVANRGAGTVVSYIGDVVTTLTIPNIVAPSGLAIDPSGSLLVAGRTTGNIVRVPNEAGVLTPADAVIIRANPRSAASVSIDAAGNLYTADSSGSAVYGVQRTAAAVNFGSVNAGSLGTPANLYVESAGNLALTEGSPLLSAPTAMFSLAPAASNGCVAGGTLAAGTSCALTANFTPAKISASGTYTSASTVTTSALNTPGTIVLTGTAVGAPQGTPQTITFTQPASPVTYGSDPYTLVATGGASGNPVVFTVVSGPGTVSGNTLTITGVGTILIAADQAGNATYAPATEVTRSVVVSQASQAITFTPPASPVAYTSTPIALTAAGGASGNPVTFSVVSGPATVSGNQLSLTGVGTVVVGANQAGNTNYSAAPQVTQSIVVNQATQTIVFTAPPSPVTFSANTVLLNATGGGSGNPVVFTIVSGPGTVSGNTLTEIGIGTIVIAANEAGSANYSAAPQVMQSVVVSPIGPVATPTFSLAAGTYFQGQTLYLSDATPGAMLYFTTDGSAPTAASTAYTGTTAKNGISLSVTATVNVIAILTGYSNSAVASATFTITNSNPTFTYTLTPASLTVARGQTGTITIVVTPMNGFNQVVSFGCSGLPSGGSCAFSPATVTTLPTQAPVSTVMTITAPTTLAQLNDIPGRILPGLSLASLLMLFGFRKRRSLRLVALACFVSLGLTMVSGCGSTTATNNVVPVTVSIGGGSVRQSTVVNLTIQ